MSEAKRLAAEKAIEYVEKGMIVGVGTGSTVAYFIEALARIKDQIQGAVSSSEQSTALLKGHGIEVLDLNHTGGLSLYVDGADECDPHKNLIKGGGAALTREKIIAEASKTFVCIVDPSKQVPRSRHRPHPGQQRPADPHRGSRTGRVLRSPRPGDADRRPGRRPALNAPGRCQPWLARRSGGCGP